MTITATRTIAWLLLTTLLTGETVYAAGPGDLTFPRDLPQVNLGSEFIMRNDSEETLVPVYLLGAVAKPGIYHLPARTDLITLLSLSGGPIPGAELSDVTIKRENGEKGTPEVLRYDFVKLVDQSGPRGPALARGDIVYVPQQAPAVSNNTMLLVTVATSVLGIIVSAVVLARGR